MFCKSLDYVLKSPYLATEISEVIALLLALCQSLVKESQTANLATSNMNPLIFTFLYMQIPLGVLLHNENKLDEMGKILAHYMKLVPTVEAEGHLQLPNGSVIDFDDTLFFLEVISLLSLEFVEHRHSVIHKRGVLTGLKE